MKMNVSHIIRYYFLNVLITTILFILFNSSLKAQENYIATHDDSLALENVIVEKYYVADSTDYADTTGGVLPKGSITYRIYIDLKPGYSLQVVYGNQKHEMYLRTTTKFFNNRECAAVTGYNIDARKINKNSIALDSWVTMGAATRLHTGVLKSEDPDGSLMERKTLNKADGLTKGVMPTFKVFNIDLRFFNDENNATNFYTTNGGWAALEGVKGPTAENRILIAQLTTNGILTFALNIQIGTPTHHAVKFVAHDPENSEIEFKGLTNTKL